MPNQQSWFDRISIQWPGVTLPYSFKKLAAECIRQCPHESEVPYLLAFIFIHMHLDNLLFQNFATIQFASRGSITDQYPLSQLEEYTRKARTGDLIERIKYLADFVKPTDAGDVDTSLVDSYERESLRRLIDIRDYLTHAKLLTSSLMGVGLSHHGLQGSNTMEELEAAFRLAIVLEHRLECAKLHIERTLFDRACTCYSTAASKRTGKSISFRCDVFKSPEGRYRPLISQTDHPSPKLSEVARGWISFKTLHEWFWPAGDYVDSLALALDNAREYAKGRCRGSDVPPFETKSGPVAKPNVDRKRDWPWKRYSTQDKWTTREFSRLVINQSQSSRNPR